MKDSTKLSKRELGEIAALYMSEFERGTHSRLDREGAAEYNTRLWYNAVATFMAQDVKSLTARLDVALTQLADSKAQAAVLQDRVYTACSEYYGEAKRHQATLTKLNELLAKMPLELK